MEAVLGLLLLLILAGYFAPLFIGALTFVQKAKIERARYAKCVDEARRNYEAAATRDRLNHERV